MKIPRRSHCRPGTRPAGVAVWTATPSLWQAVDTRREHESGPPSTCRMPPHPARGRCSSPRGTGTTMQRRSREPVVKAMYSRSRTRSAIGCPGDEFHRNVQADGSDPTTIGENRGVRTGLTWRTAGASARRRAMDSVCGRGPQDRRLVTPAAELSTNQISSRPRTGADPRFRRSRSPGRRSTSNWWSGWSARALRPWLDPANDCNSTMTIP